MNYCKAILIMAITATCALATVPSTMLFQGNMSESEVPVNGARSLDLKLFDASTGGSLVWEETFGRVDFRNGYFAVQLGKITTLPQFEKPLFVELLLDGNAGAERIPLSTAPYAQRASIADSSVKANFATSAGKSDFAVTAETANNLAAGSIVANATNAVFATNAESANGYNSANSLTTSGAVTAGNFQTSGSLNADAVVAASLTAENVISNGFFKMPLNTTGNLFADCSQTEHLGRLRLTQYSNGGTMILFVCRLNTAGVPSWGALATN